MTEEYFKRWALGFSGCDGGDIGSPENPSTWLCGIEWGIGFNEDELENIFKNNEESIPKGYENNEENLAYQFNQKALKLLASLNGYANILKFNEEVKPFVINSKGYFKLNLYPLAFKNTDFTLWNEQFSIATGFKTKNEYIQWIQENRFKEMRKRVKIYKPKLIICVGISYKDDFIKAFGDDNVDIKQSEAGGKKFYYFKNKDGTLVVITYFLGNRFGLSSDLMLKETGKEIARLLKFTL